MNYQNGRGVYIVMVSSGIGGGGVDDDIELSTYPGGTA